MATVDETVCVFTLDAGFNSRVVSRTWKDDVRCLLDALESFEEKSFETAVSELHQLHGEDAAKEMFLESETMVGVDSPLIQSELTIGTLLPHVIVWGEERGPETPPRYACGPSLPEDDVLEGVTIVPLVTCGMSVWWRLESDGEKTMSSCEIYVEG